MSTTASSNWLSTGKEKRLSRACLSCRSRKTRCQLQFNNASRHGPCRRCFELGIQCTFAASRRGGRRVKGSKSAPIAEDEAAEQEPSSPLSQSQGSGHGFGADSTCVGHGNRSNHISMTTPSGDGQARPNDFNWAATREQRTSSRQSRSRSPGTSTSLVGHITSTDLLNPSDALDLLAQVADLEPNGRQVDSAQPLNPDSDPPPVNHSQPLPDYQPVSGGVLTLSNITLLLQHYHEKFHPFFPIADTAIFENRNVATSIIKEPHLVTAILIVASRDDSNWVRAHEACCQYMDSLISSLIYTGSTTIGAVEALLILAEWAPQPLRELQPIGCGKEDQGSWMLIGMAIRLGYLQGLEQSGLVHSEQTSHEDRNRQLIAWTACYMCDRQVSIRLGKGFWSRGPGPSITFRSPHLPSLECQKLGTENMALLFQANVELIQLFSNAHDVLYSSTGHREQLYIGGEYVRYIDDFASVLRKWKLSWGGLSFTPAVKSSLTLSYDFLRLYINAFAFQASLNRAIRDNHRYRSSSQAKRSPLFHNVAESCDARFIYESIDAANSLLGTFNGYIDPRKSLRYMPLKFSLYIIYASVFLFKATVSGAIKPDEAKGVRRAVHGAVIRLQDTSDNRHSLGHSYARSLGLLWRKSACENASSTCTRVPPPAEPSVSPTQSVNWHRPIVLAPERDRMPELDPLSGFSWLDLNSLGNFVAHDGNLSVTDVALTTPEIDLDQNLQNLTGGTWPDALCTPNDIVF